MDDKELEKTKPIEVINEDLENRSDKYKDVGQEEESREEKYKNALEDEHKKIEEEAAEEALAEKNIALAESYLEEEKNQINQNEQLNKQSFIGKIKDKWSSLDKKKKIMIIVIGLLILILLVVFIIFVVVKSGNKDEIEKPEEKIEEKAPVVVENYYYKDGKLYFLNESSKEIGIYECENKDSNLCYLAENNYRDNFDVAMLADDTGEEKVGRMPIYNEDYVFVVDNKEVKSKEIKLYSIKEEVVSKTYDNVKAFDEDYVIVSENGLYGLLEINEKVNEIIKPTYEYLGLIDGQNNLVAKTKKGFFIIDRDNKELSSMFSSNYEIKNYNDNFVVAKVGGEYNVYNYQGDLLAAGYKYVTLNDDYAGLVNSSKELFIIDKDRTKFNEEGISLKNDNYNRVYVYRENGTLDKVLKSFDINVRNGIIEVAVYEKDGDNPQYKNLEINEGLANKKNKFVNYFDGKLYFYKDEDKNIKIGTYTCNSKNYLSKEEDEHEYCFLAKDTIYEDNDMMPVGYKDRKAYSPIINSRFVFILDGTNNIKLYDLVDNKALGVYSSVNTYTSNNDYSVTFVNNRIDVVAVNKKGKYGMLTIDGVNVKATYPFEYNKIEKIEGGYLVQTTNNKWKMLFNDGSESVEFDGEIKGYSSDKKYYKLYVNGQYSVYGSSGDKVSIDSCNYIELYSDYYVGIDKDSKLFIYGYNGNKLITEGVQLANYPFNNTANPAFKVKKSGESYIVSVYDGTKYNDVFLSLKTDIEEPDQSEKEEV